MTMTVIYLILLIAALVCFLIAAFAPSQPARINLVALGLGFWVSIALIQTVQTL